MVTAQLTEMRNQLPGVLVASGDGLQVLFQRDSSVELQKPTSDESTRILRKAGLKKVQEATMRRDRLERIKKSFPVELNGKELPQWRALHHSRTTAKEYEYDNLPDMVLQEIAEISSAGLFDRIDIWCSQLTLRNPDKARLYIVGVLEKNADIRYFGIARLGREILTLKNIRNKNLLTRVWLYAVSVVRKVSWFIYLSIPVISTLALLLAIPTATAWLLVFGIIGYIVFFVWFCCPIGLVDTSNY